jgi:hypothetical protein
MLCGRLRHCLHGFGVRNIAYVHQRLAAGRLDLPRDALGFGAVAACIDDDRRATLGQSQRNRTADVAPGARDDSYFAGEFACHWPLSPQRRKIDATVIKPRHQF